MLEEDFADLQTEIRAIKNALRDGTVFLGMTGEKLQRYLLQLNEKENLLLSHKLRNMPTEEQVSSAANHEGGPIPTGATPRVASVSEPSALQVEEADASSTVVPPGSAELQAEGPASSRPGVSPVAALPRVVARDSPVGPTRALDRFSLENVTAHLVDYESSSVESAKALRCLSSLAYTDADAVGGNDRVLPQILRTIGIHFDDDQVQLAAMRAFCNMAYSSSISLNKLATDNGVVVTLVDAMVRHEKKEIGAKAGETVARMVAAEVGTTSTDGEAPNPPQAVDSACTQSPLAVLLAASLENSSGDHVVAEKLVTQLISNEVVDVPMVASRFVASASIVRPSATASASWLRLARALCSPNEYEDMPSGLVEEGAIAAAADLVTSHAADGSVQLAGIESLSSLVGSRKSGLDKFAAVKGMQILENAMRAHADEVILQTKCTRALASGLIWDPEVQQKSGYNWRNSVKLTKAAMARHGSDVDLQIAGLEALTNYLEHLACIEEVKADGGEGLVKAILIRHLNVPKLVNHAKNLFRALGLPDDWTPKGVVAS
eukprot:TRINITY_DN68641_c0_g1_i1.p1 TRINITY_DN68641_c0_g1~~TRINITY_DN68641_c0_g1_i1.p1  ORF type:complete len:578 (+),score=81.22 TRINITY_DN68641_c0_g1_i1:89-1735(+)